MNDLLTYRRWSFWNRPNIRAGLDHELPNERQAVAPHKTAEKARKEGK